MKRLESATRQGARWLVGAVVLATFGTTRLMAEVPAPDAPPPEDTVPAETRIERGRVEELVNIFADSLLKPGWRAGVAVTVFGNAQIEGDVDDVCVTVFGNARVNGRVRHECVTVFGNLDLNGKVGGDLVVFMGDARLGPQAEVHGQTIVIGGKVHTAPGATLHGQKWQLAGFLPAVGEWFRYGLLLGRPIAPGVGWVWWVVAVHCVLYLLVAALLPRPVEAVEQTLERQALTSFGVGLLGLILAAPLSFVLLASGVGLLVLPLLFVALLMAVWLGKTAAFQWMGRSLCRRFSVAGTCPPLLGFVVGFGLVTLLYMVPGVGFVVYGLLIPLAFGAALLAVVDAVRASRASRTPPVPAPSPAPSPAPPVSPVPPLAPPSPEVTPPPPVPAGPGPASATAALAMPVVGGPAEKSASESMPGVSATPSMSPPGETAPAAGGSGGGSPPPSPPAAPVVAPPIGTAGPGPAEWVSLPRAGFWIRTGAAALDVLLLAWLLAPLPGALPGPLFVLVLIAYHAAFWAWKGTTLGGIVCGLKVVRADGRPVDVAVALVRALAAVFSALPLFLGFFWAGWSAERRSWHDLIAGTLVVRVPKGEPLI